MYDPDVDGNQFPLAIIATSSTHVQVVWAESADTFSIDPVWDGDNPSVRQHVIASTVDCLAAVAASRNQQVSLHTASQIATSRAAEHPQLVIVGRSEQVDALLAAAAQARQADKLSRFLMIGTDASGTPGRRSVATAWADSEGRWGAYTLQDTSTGVGELHAIVRAAECASPERDLLIVTDSKTAMQIATGTSKARTLDGSMLLERLRGLIGNRQIMVRWVPSHTGVRINETAHRLALNELRRTSLRVKLAVSRRVAAQIVEDFLAEPNPPLPAGEDSDLGLVPRSMRTTAKRPKTTAA